jgi:hypothetical protein
MMSKASKKIFLLIPMRILINMTCGCIEPPPSGIIQISEDEIDLEWDYEDLWDNSSDQYIGWIVTGNATNIHTKKALWLRIRGNFYDATGEDFFTSDDFDYENELVSGDSFDFMIEWTWEDDEWSSKGAREDFPQDITVTCEVWDGEFELNI